MLRKFFEGTASGVGIVLGILLVIMLMQVSAYFLQQMGVLP